MEGHSRTTSAGCLALVVRHAQASSHLGPDLPAALDDIAEYHIAALRACSGSLVAKARCCCLSDRRTATGREFAVA